MDRHRFSAIAHGELPFWNPIDPARLSAWVDDLALPPGPRVLDVGCGRAELMLTVHARHGGSGLGFDVGAPAVERARAEIAARAPDADLVVRCEPFEPDGLPLGSFDLVACLGASQACGTFDDALRLLSPLLAPGGLLLVGEGCWQREPDPDYLAFLGMAADDMPLHAGNIALAARRGLSCVRDHETTLDEWDRYEGTYAANVRAHLAAHPDDPDADAMGARIEGWRDAYERWGRGTMGFGLYLFARS